jgi:hypothetical protein
MGIGKHAEHSAPLWLSSYNRSLDLTAPFRSKEIAVSPECSQIPISLRPVTSATLISIAAWRPIATRPFPQPPNLSIASHTMTDPLRPLTASTIGPWRGDSHSMFHAYRENGPLQG